MVEDNAESTPSMPELFSQAEMMAFLDESLADADVGKTVPALEALDALARKYNLTSKIRN